MKAFADLIGRVLEIIAKVVSFSVPLIAVIVLIEIMSRMFFHVSLPWAADVAAWLMCALIMLGGASTLAMGKFVRVDALYSNFAPRTRLWIDTVVTSTLLLILCVILIRHGYTFAERAFMSGERPASANWNAPVWAVKALIPVGASLMILGWLRYLLVEWHDYLHPDQARTHDDEEMQLHG